MTMNEERKTELAAAVMQVMQGMDSACNVVVRQAVEEGIVYPIHGSQLADPPGSVTNLWKVRIKTEADGYARNFDEQRQTLNEISAILASEERDRETARVESERMD